MEFTVNIDETNKKISNVNQALLKQGIQGGKDLTTEFPELGNTALFCVTEIHSQDNIERLAHSLKEVIQ
jgi:glycine dehydrogenase subunit 1